MKNNHTPEIRFSGFTGDWEERKFGDMYDVVSGYAFKMSDYVQVGVPIVNGESIQHGSISAKNLNFLPEEFSDKYQNFILDTGDIVLGLNRPITNGNLKIAQVPKDLHGALLYQRAGKIIILNNSNINFSYQLLGKEVSKFVLKEAVGSDQPFISTTKLKQWLICVPTLEEEQTKIGNFLKQLDDTISLHQQELTTLKQTKQGFLQKMFPKEGESVPEVRFPGFTRDWEQRKLNEVAEIIGGGTPSTDVQEYWDGDIDWYSPVEIGKETYAFGSQRKITALGLKKSSAKVLPANKTMLFTSRAGIGDMAILKKDGATNQGFQSLVVNKNYDIYFIYSMGYKIKEFALKYASGSTFLEISGKILGKMDLFVPPLEEQSKIGNFFKQLDDTIALHQHELDSLKETKKAFLQRMFV
ncbi:restriction endonuclease subunit S [Bacillus sp. 1NLA3E]|uniref:restriction endonuclease subunit S n=1 Tax=Bacillus sp. 1NLA3E TaxID=666686 RepID=UPI000247E6FA|nr:restriction endonuclease subunit S [Bacillus sp. 1NLA3E]AGK54888.1 restriction modification system DNA specificity domain-containing protein [Bacillus sp. 1NLA3E]